MYFISQYFLSSSTSADSAMTPTPKLVRKRPIRIKFEKSATTSPSKECAPKRSSTEVAPVPRKIPRIDHGSSVNIPPTAVVSNSVVNSENRYVAMLVIIPPF